MVRANASTVSGPMSRPFQPVRDPIGRRPISRGASADISCAATTSTGSTIGTPRSAARVDDRPDLVEPVGLDQAVADRAPAGRDQRERHRAADQQRVDAIDERVDHGELVGDLRPAEDRDVRARRVARADARAPRPRAAAAGRPRPGDRSRASARAAPRRSRARGGRRRTRRRRRRRRARRAGPRTPGRSPPRPGRTGGSRAGPPASSGSSPRRRLRQRVATGRSRSSASRAPAGASRSSSRT